MKEEKQKQGIPPMEKYASIFGGQKPNIPWHKMKVLE
jgi:hypothetical protein